MAPFKLLNLLAFTALAVLSSSFAPASVAALSLGHDAAHVARGHDGLAKRMNKRSSNLQRRCKTRSAPSASATVTSSSSSHVATTTKATTTPTTHTTSSTHTSAKAAATPAKESTSTSSGSSSSGGSGKIGVGWANPSWVDSSLHLYKTDQTSFIYTWSPYLVEGASDLGFTNMAMLWGDKQISEWEQYVVNGADDYAEWAMGPNEPNESSQANMSPGDAASLWKTYIQPLKSRGYKLLSPACTSGTDGMTWMQQFFDACTGCTFDAVGLHYYGTDPQGLISYAESFWSAWGIPVMITEAACENFGSGSQCDAGDVQNFLNTVISYVDSTDHMMGFFPYGFLTSMYNVNTLNQLMDPSTGAPTALGNSVLY